MILMVALSGLFFLSVAYISVSGILKPRLQSGTGCDFLPRSRTEMIRGLASIAVVFSHIASYSKPSAAAGLLRYYNLFCASLGGVGVNLFFCLSGYGNYYSALKNRTSLGRWLWKRCATLLIVYVCCLFAVLGILYAGGYRISVRGLLDNLLHLTIPYSSVWYVKIQLLVYGFLVFSIRFGKRENRVVAVFALCLLSAVLLFLFGLDEKWWKSTACFAAGVFAAAYRPELERILQQRRNAVLFGSIAVFPFAYFCAVLVDYFAVKTLGNLVLCAAIMAIIELLQMDDPFYAKLGAYSLALYLVHRSFVAWILNDGVTTAIKIVMIVVVSAALTVVVKWISDRLIKLCFGKS